MANLSYGSKGDEVKRLQEQLNGKGYKLDTDGVFGANTQAAVKDYQSKNGLSVDGIVGEKTWGSLENQGVELQQTNEKSQKAVAPSALSAVRPRYEESEELSDVRGELDDWKSRKPSQYSGTYEQQIDGLLSDIMNGEKFSYDMDADALYNQYKDNYVRQGQRAMQDTVGQAAALTGGYGSSYGVTAGSEAYQEYLTRLNDIIPELQEAAYNKYLDENEFKREALRLLSEQDDAEYSRYRDSVSDYRYDGESLKAELSDMSDAEWNRFLELASEYESDRDFDLSRQKLDYQKEQDALAQKNWEREYELSRTAAAARSSGGGSSSSKSSGKSAKNELSRDELLDMYESGVLDYPVTYSAFVKTTGYSGVLSESEFAKRGTAKYEYDSYEAYLKDMFDKYFMK